MSSELTTDGSEQFQFSGFGPAHAGVMLLQARKTRGLSLEELSAQLKVPVRKLEQLEAGQFGEIAGGMAYVRALCRAVCKALKVDEKPVLELMPSSNTKAPLPDEEPGLGAPFANSERMGRLGVRAPARGDVPRNIWAWAAGAVLLGAAALFVWPWLHARWAQQFPAGKPFAAASADVEASKKAVSPSEPRLALQPSASIPADATLPVAVAQPAASAATELTQAAVPAAATLLTIEASEPTWVEISNDDGAVLVSRNLNPGERIEQGLERKRNVVIGNAAGAHVWLRGASMDIQPYSRNNVARFDVR